MSNYVDLDEVKIEFLKYAPAYATVEASIALDKIMDLQKQGIIRNGIFYIVLVDLVGSTKFGAESGNEMLSEKIKWFVTSSFNALNDTKLKNVGLFIKEIGDAVLFVFQHFPDILRWYHYYTKWLNIGGGKGKWGAFEIRTCIHIGEVYLQGVNPISLAVSQTFKMEKMVKAEEIVLTQAAYHAAWPTLARAYHAFEISGEIQMEGSKENTNLYRLVFSPDILSTLDISEESID